MKKKITKKLALSKETLRHLGPQEMKDVVGGKPPVTCSCYPEICPSDASCTCC